MRAWGLGATLLALVCAQGAAAQVAEIPEAHLLLLDRSALAPTDAARDGQRFAEAEKTIYRALMAQHGANLILDLSAAPAHWSGLDVTGEAIAALRTAIPEWSPRAQPAPPASAAAAAPPVRMLFIDLGFPISSDAKFHETLERVASGKGATLVVDRRIVVMGPPGLDITALVDRSLETYRSTGSPPLVVGGPDVPFARVAILDRRSLMHNSSVGQSMAAEMRAIVANSDSKLRAQAEALKTEGARLKMRISAFSPDEKQKAMQDYAERQKAFSAKVQARQGELNAAVIAAQKKIEAAATPIVLQILKDDHANMMLDGMAVVASDDALDITAPAIEKLNAALPHVDVVLAPAEK